MNKLNVRIVKNKKVGSDYYLMVLHSPVISNTIKPGQFLQLKVSSKKTYDPILRRPFSIHDIDRKEKNISILYRSIGRGTKLMANFEKGKIVDVLGPLGNGFSTDIANKKILILGGGMGIAPLYPLSNELSFDNQVQVLIGGNTQDDIKYFMNIFSKIKVEIESCTIDGSCGYKGNIIDLWEINRSRKYDFLYACGPEPMLVKVQDLSKKYNISGEVSLEEHMGCGIGVCLSCVCQTIEGNQRVCKEGPVFSLGKVKFN